MMVGTRPTKLLEQLNDIRVHLNMVVQALQVVQVSMNKIGESVADMRLEEKPKLRLVVNNEVKG